MKCSCLDVPLPSEQYETVKFIGVDETNGRFGEVTLKRCLHCGRLWLHYLVEYESLSESTRYFMGLISSEEVETITPEMAVAYLRSLQWHLYGGSYFKKAGRSSIQQIDVDR